MLKINNLDRTVFMMGTGLLMGLLFSFQSKSVNQANISFGRENRLNIFKEMQIVKQGNQALSEQLIALQKELANGNNREKALESIQKDIFRYQLASGKTNIHGPGIKIVIDSELESLWFTDMINELYLAGAEAISLNGIRINNEHIGFDTMPNGQILFGGEILSAPFNFEAIGDSKTLLGSVNQAGGIVNRIINYHPNYQIRTAEVDDITMPADKAE